ncbi:B3 domain-containing transcription factor VRN1-like isoform X2 [Trifolium pratense]|uniref:B3 domain-containing transcription factor VRN1-like isoform X2 n=1 Tax=Trifolium pratense TaxID=57577 RepID=UPI001E69007A|nr:B3 domain-containing transcription factor VRN1-like isoform X2 [Trifolium pratense]
MSIHHGRGSEAKGMHFYQTIQLRQLQDQQLMVPRNFVERYWKDVSNPISLRLPNESMCKMFWVQLGDDIWLQDWKRFARSLRCGDLLVFQYKGGSYFHVIIFDDSKLEIDYSSMICNDEQEDKESDDDDDDDDGYAEITNDCDNTKQSLKKKKINSNDSATTFATPQVKKIHKRKINMKATQQKISEANGKIGGSGKKATKSSKTVDANKRRCTNSHHPDENPNFTLKLSRSCVEGHKLRLTIPSWFSKEYMNELLQGNATIRSVSDEKTWHVTLSFDERNRNFKMGGGWRSFSREHNLQVGDECKFEMTEREPLSFAITIVQATKEPCPEQFQENQRVKEKSETSPVVDMDNVGNFGEGISRSCPKTHDYESPNLHNKFKVSVTTLDKLIIPSEFLKRHNISNGNSVELKVGEGTWFVEVSYNEDLDYGGFTKGWKEFVRECKVKIGDTCFFEMIDLQNHVFKVSIILDV